jgi:hypothetical protein
MIMKILRKILRLWLLMLSIIDTTLEKLIERIFPHIIYSLLTISGRINKYIINCLGIFLDFFQKKYKILMNSIKST